MNDCTAKPRQPDDKRPIPLLSTAYSLKTDSSTDIQLTYCNMYAAVVLAIAIVVRVVEPEAALLLNIS